MNMHGMPITCAFACAGSSGRRIQRGQHPGGAPGCHWRHHEGPRKQGIPAACMQAPVALHSLHSSRLSALSWLLNYFAAHAVFRCKERHLATAAPPRCFRSRCSPCARCRRLQQAGRGRSPYRRPALGPAPAAVVMQRAAEGSHRGRSCLSPRELTPDQAITNMWAGQRDLLVIPERTSMALIAGRSHFAAWGYHTIWKPVDNALHAGSAFERKACVCRSNW